MLPNVEPNLVAQTVTVTFQVIHRFSSVSYWSFPIVKASNGSQKSQQRSLKVSNCEFQFNIARWARLFSTIGKFAQR